MEAIALTPKSTAALIRTILRRAFPATKFSVTIGRGSGVSSVRVRWTDGPTVKSVERFVAPFECGSFDGMTDSYNYAKGADRYLIVDGQTYHTGTRYVQTSRTVSPALANRCIAAIAAYWGGVDVVPQAVPATWGDGYRLEPAIGRQPVRPDLGGFDHDWDTMIYRCASDRTQFTRTHD